MPRDTQHFQAHVPRPPFYKKPGSLAAIGLLLGLVGFAVFCFKVDEKVLVTRAQALDGTSAYAAYVIGIRGVQSDATRDALENLLEKYEGEKPTPEGLRRGCAYALGSVKTPQVVSFLSDVGMKDPSPDVRATSARALGKSGSLGAAEPLNKALDDHEADVRVAAAQGCANLKDDRNVDKLIERIMDPIFEVRKACCRALVATTGQDFDLDGAAWKRWREKR
jgi:HEAT repeat protein